MREWVGGRGKEVMVVGGQAEGGFTLPLGTGNGPVFPVGDRDVHNPQER